MKAKVIGAMVVVLAMVSAASATSDFTLTGSQELTVNTQATPSSSGYLYGLSRVYLVTGGQLYTLYAYETSTVDISGGLLNGGVYAEGSSTAVITGGIVGDLHTYDNSTLEISGGDVSDLHTYGSSNVNISGGTAAWPYAYDNSTVNVSGGSVNRHFFAYNTSTVNVSGGQLHNHLRAYNNSIVNISGGAVDDRVTAHDTSNVNISGGLLNNGLSAYDTSTVTFYGQDFFLGDGLSLNGDEVLGTGILSGEWFDGTAWAIPISTHDADATIRLVSEPATVIPEPLTAMSCLIGLGIVGGYIRKRRLA